MHHESPGEPQQKNHCGDLSGLEWGHPNGTILLEDQPVNWQRNVRIFIFHIIPSQRVSILEEAIDNHIDEINLQMSASLFSDPCQCLLRGPMNKVALTAEMQKTPQLKRLDFQLVPSRGPSFSIRVANTGTILLGNLPVTWQQIDCTVVLTSWKE